jgi:hypothetical protein
MKRMLVWPAAILLLPGGIAAVVGTGTAQAHPGLTPFPADNDDWGPAHHWCPGQKPVPTTGNHITDPLNWDWNVCHTYYFIWPGMGNVSSMIWDGDDPPPKPPPAPALNFCPNPAVVPVMS